MTESITRTYTVRMDVAAPLARRRIWSRLVWLGGTAAVAGAAVSLLTMANVTAFPIVVALAISVISLVIVGRRTVAREVNALASYRLTLGETSLRRVVDGVAPAEMGRDEVTRIMEGPFGLIVEGSGRSVVVPTVLDGYEEARRQLVSWRAITSPERTRLARQKGLGALIAVALIAAWVGSAWVPTVAGRIAAAVVLYGLLAVVLSQTLRNPDAPRALKRAVVLMAVIMGLAPISRWLLERGLPELGIVPESTGTNMREPLPGTESEGSAMNVRPAEHTAAADGRFAPAENRRVSQAK